MMGSTRACLSLSIEKYTEQRDGAVALGVAGLLVLLENCNYQSSSPDVKDFDLVQARKQRYIGTTLMTDLR